MTAQIQEKDRAIAVLNDQMLELQDEKLDFQSKLENNDEKEHQLNQEICKLMDTISGKDTAIRQLSEQLIEGEKEKARLSEMIQEMRRKNIIEKSFQNNFAAVKCSGHSMGPIKNNQDLTIGFVRDQNDEDEFFLEIVMKAKNPKTGNKDILRIAVDDIDEIEHVEGTYQFYIHYQGRVADDVASSISGFIKKKIG